MSDNVTELKTELMRAALSLGENEESAKIVIDIAKKIESIRELNILETCGLASAFESLKDFNNSEILYEKLTSCGIKSLQDQCKQEGIDLVVLDSDYATSIFLSAAKVKLCVNKYKDAFELFTQAYQFGVKLYPKMFDDNFYSLYEYSWYEMSDENKSWRALYENVHSILTDKNISLSEKHERTISDISVLEKRAPNIASILWRVGLCYSIIGKGDYTKARIWVSKAIEIDPNYQNAIEELQLIDEYEKELSKTEQTSSFVSLPRLLFVVVTIMLIIYYIFR